MLEITPRKTLVSGLSKAISNSWLHPLSDILSNLDNVEDTQHFNDDIKRMIHLILVCLCCLGLIKKSRLEYPLAVQSCETLN